MIESTLTSWSETAPICELEEQERQARRDLRRGPPRAPRYTPEQLAEVPF